MNRYPYRKGPKKRPTLKALIERSPPNPGRTSGGIGWEYVYPTAPLCRHEDPIPDEEPSRYDATPTLATGPGGEGG